MTVPTPPDGSSANAVIDIDPITGLAPKQFTLLNNVTATGTPVTGVPSGAYNWAISSTGWNGATATLQCRAPDGTSWLDITTATANAVKGVGISGNAELRVAITAAVPSAGVYSTITP